jgi:pimeloyl-ACP methyl ester carboxylesterase
LEVTMTALARSIPTWLDRSLYPFATRRFATAHGELSYVDEGRGSPILLVHGTPSWSFEWRHTIASLSKSHRVIAPDHLGFGLSDKPIDVPYTPADHAGRLLAFVRALDLSDVTLVVHDFGGPIGLGAMLAEPERVRSLVVMNTWAWPHAGDPRIARASKLFGSTFGRLLYTRLNLSPRWLLPLSFGDRAKLTHAVHRHYLAPFASRHERAAPWVLARELAASDPFYATSWDRRATIAKWPSTIVWGARDPAFGVSYLAKWRSMLPRAEVIELPTAGHFPQEEEPEAVTRAIAARARRGARRSASSQLAQSKRS